MAAPRRKKTINKQEEIHYCRECARCVPDLTFYTLSIKGEPTLGKCPYVRVGRCVLLSDRSCEHFIPSL